LVVFATFWQAVIVVCAIDVHFLGDTETYTSNQVSGGINAFMICIEMAIAALAHIWVWPAKEFENVKGDSPKLSHILNPVDLIRDMYLFLIQPVIRAVKNEPYAKTKIDKSGAIEIHIVPTITNIDIDLDAIPAQESNDEEDSSDDEIIAVPSAPPDRSVRQVAPSQT